MDSYAHSFGGATDSTKVTHENYLEKLQRSCAGIVAGLIILCLGLAVAGWNEYREVATEQKLLAASDSVRDISCFSSPPDSTDAKDLVHLSCDISGKQLLTAPLFNTTTAIGTRLGVLVEVYQIKESYTQSCTKDALGGGTTCTKKYSYKYAYSSVAPDTYIAAPATCMAQLGLLLSTCTNRDPTQLSSWSSPSAGAPVIKSPGSTVLKAAPGGGFGAGYVRGTSTAARADLSLGNYKLPMDMVDKLGTVASTQTVYAYVQDGQPVDSNGANVKLTFTLYNDAAASVMAQQSLNTFAAWPSPYDSSYTVYDIRSGNISSKDMITIAGNENSNMTWFLRFVSWVAVFVGLSLVTAPLTVVADIIPCFGPLISGMVGAVLCVFDCFVTCCCWCIVAGASWVYFRPAIGIPLVVLGCAMFLAVIAWRCLMPSSPPENNNKEMEPMPPPEAARSFDPPPMQYSAPPPPVATFGHA